MKRVVLGFVFIAVWALPEMVLAVAVGKNRLGCGAQVNVDIEVASFALGELEVISYIRAHKSESYRRFLVFENQNWVLTLDFEPDPTKKQPALSCIVDYGSKDDIARGDWELPVYHKQIECLPDREIGGGPHPVGYKRCDP